MTTSCLSSGSKVLATLEITDCSLSSEFHRQLKGKCGWDGVRQSSGNSGGLGGVEMLCKEICSSIRGRIFENVDSLLYLVHLTLSFPYNTWGLAIVGHMLALVWEPKLNPGIKSVVWVNLLVAKSRH